MKNPYYENLRRNTKLPSHSDRHAENNQIVSYFKKNWLGITVEKSIEELWDQYSLVAEKLLKAEDST